MDFAETTNPGSYAGMEGAYFSCEDMEFQAEWDEITVLPNFQGKKLAMICVRACASPCTLESCHARCASPWFSFEIAGRVRAVHPQRACEGAAVHRNEPQGGS